MNIFKKIIKFNFCRATIIFMAILMIIGFLVEIVTVKTVSEDSMHVPYIVYPVHLMVKALEKTCESVTPQSESGMGYCNSSLGIIASVLYNFYYYFFAYFIYRIFKKYLLKNKKIINIVFINRFKEIIKFSFGRVIIATALVVIPTMIINFLIKSMPPSMDEMPFGKTTYKYITYVSIPQYPIQLVKRTLTSTCKLATPPSDDIFRCYGKFMSIISLLLSVAYNYFLACLMYLGFEKLFKKKDKIDTKLKS